MKKRAIALLIGTLLLTSFPMTGYGYDQTEVTGEVNIDESEQKLIFQSYSIGTDFEGNPLIALFFDYTNNSSEPKFAQTDFYITVYQNGKEQQISFLPAGSEFQEAYDNSVTNIKDGATLPICVTYSLEDTESLVEVNVTNFQNYDETANRSLEIDISKFGVPADSETVSSSETELTESIELETQKTFESEYNDLLEKYETLQSDYDTLLTEHEQCDLEPVTTEIEFTSDSLLNAEEVFQQLSDDDLQYVIDNAQNELDSRIDNLATEANDEDFGNWDVKYYVDQFNLPTDEAYISYNDLFTGTFSNSATSDSLLYAKLLIDEDITIMLYEYGSQQVTAYSSTDYNIIMLDENGNKTQLVGVMHDNGDRVIITRDYTQTVLDALKAGGEISFYLAEKDHSITNYLFTIPDATGFDNAYNSIGF